MRELDAGTARQPAAAPCRRPKGRLRTTTRAITSKTSTTSCPPKRPASSSTGSTSCGATSTTSASTSTTRSLPAENSETLRRRSDRSEPPWPLPMAETSNRGRAHQNRRAEATSTREAAGHPLSRLVITLGDHPIAPRRRPLPGRWPSARSSAPATRSHQADERKVAEAKAGSSSAPGRGAIVSWDHRRQLNAATSGRVGLAVGLRLMQQSGW
jgi:hypothetical protein